MEQQIMVDRLPVRTWNRLQVNEAYVPWDTSAETDLGTEHCSASDGSLLRRSFAGQGTYSKQGIVLDAPENTSVTLVELYENAQKLSVETQLDIGKNASVRLIQVQLGAPGSVLRTAVTGACAQGGSLELIQVFPGPGDVYSDCHVTLRGDGSRMEADIGYLGQDTQTVDLNLAVEHFGQKTESRIRADGALKGSAQKTFRGTIDFKTGSAGSVGNEQETVLMLGENAVNKTVPLILCAEENVEGNHGATIGELDSDTLFYFESRGFDRTTAENILARAAIERLARKIGDEQTAQRILQAIGGDDDGTV